jgi:hypothetical protein
LLSVYKTVLLLKHAGLVGKPGSVAPASGTKTNCHIKSQPLQTLVGSRISQQVSQAGQHPAACPSTTAEHLHSHPKTSTTINMNGGLVMLMFK